MLLRTMNNKKELGSITIEAAIVLPIVISVIILIFTLSTVVYKHVKVQTLLNQVCLELSYDSYMFDELGVVGTIQEINEISSGDKLTFEEIQAFGELLSSEPITSVDQDTQLKTSYSNPLEFVEVITSGLDYIDQSLTYGNKIKDTFINEGLYYITTTYGRRYVEERLKNSLIESGIDLDFVIEHLELFNYNDSGLIIISYNCELPFGILKNSSIQLVNSGYIQLFNGHGEYSEVYHKDIETSTYGEGKQEEEITDEDGYYKKVYITEKGTKYHKNPLCFHINVNAIPVKLGLVSFKEPCKHCVDTDLLDENSIVYTTLGSDVYHTSPTCYSIYHNISTMSEKEAILKGYEPCGTCSN